MPHSEHLIHLHHRKPIKHLPLFDRIVFIASALYPLSGIPQLIEILAGNKQGVSAISWTIFLLFAILFFIYGIRRKVFPMIATNALWIVIDGLIIAALLFS